MRKILFICFLLPGLAYAQQQLSPKAEISVMTFGPSQEFLYTAFGHSAFRVFDPVLGIDEAYNYGVFDFDQPNFYLNFAKGNLMYRLDVSDYQQFEYVYIYFNRSVREQKLNLSPTQKQTLYDFLQWNALPENQFYRYDYFYENCATKIPNILAHVFGDTIEFDGSHIRTDYSIRELTDLYLRHQPWGDLGIDICLGLPIDKQATPYEYMFLPDYVEAGMANATILKNGIREPLVKSRTVIYESRFEQMNTPWVTPLVVFSGLLILTIVLTLVDFRRERLSNFFDVVLFTTLGLVGLLLCLLWVATDHHAAAKNLNILWALPTHLIVAIAIVKKPLWLSKYFAVVAGLSLALLLAWPWLPQKLHYALVPLVTAIAMRAFTQFYLRRRQVVRISPEPAPNTENRL